MTFADKLEKNPSGDKENLMVLAARGHQISFPRRPLIMGILNVNDDSFSGDGRLDPTWARNRAAELVQAGADIVDVGGESARTNRAPVPEDAEWERIAPVIEGFSTVLAASSPRDTTQVFPPLLSVNTWRTSVAERALKAGCDLLNDLSSLPDESHARLCADSGAALLIMHSKGQPKIPHTHVIYPDVLRELEEFFQSRIRRAEDAGLHRDCLILDPGIDFAKQVEDNLRIYRDLERLKVFRRPILLPVSRKGTIGRVLSIPDPAKRDPGTVACIVAGVARGANIFRVHNVEAAWHTLRSLERLKPSSFPGTIA